MQHCPGGPHKPAPCDPRGGCWGRVTGGDGDWQLLLRGAVGFPAQALPTCTHYLFSHLFMILEEAQEERELRGGQSDPSPREEPR